ncbi:MAG: hypothetical protein RID42_09555 [Alphaproteobacteria bacterium]|jgi:hypothetical protein
MTIVGFDRRGFSGPTMTISPFKADAKTTPMLPNGTKPDLVARPRPAVAVLGKLTDEPATLHSLMFVLEDGYLLEMPLNRGSLGQLRAVLGAPDLPDGDTELTKPSWA